MFFRQVAAAVGPAANDAETLLALWELVWAGLVTNDTLAPLRRAGRRRRPPASVRVGRPRGAAPRSRRAAGRRPRPAGGA